MSTSNTKPLASPGVLSRRELLSYAWLAALAALAGAGMRAALRFVKPPLRPGEFGGVFNMGPAAELPPPGGAPVNVPMGRFMLATTEQGALALHKACTHLDCLCDWDDQSHQFICPCHGSRFAADGTYLAGPATRSLDRFVVQVVAPDGEIVAETDLALGAAVPVLPQDTPAPSADDVNRVEAEEDGSSSADPGFVVLVDTGRKILGATPDSR